MIFDNIENIEKYNILPKEVISFIYGLTEETPEGRYDISNKIYANIESYMTKEDKDALFESHRKYIDIQMLLKGSERIDYTNISELEICREYDFDRDIIFYNRPDAKVGSLYLNGKNFAVFHPQDAHAPQIRTCVNADNVKKVVVKIAVDY